MTVQACLTTAVHLDVLWLTMHKQTSVWHTLTVTDWFAHSKVVTYTHPAERWERVEVESRSTDCHNNKRIRNNWGLDFTAPPVAHYPFICLLIAYPHSSLHPLFISAPPLRVFWKQNTTVVSWTITQLNVLTFSFTICGVLRMCKMSQ